MISQHPFDFVNPRFIRIDQILERIVIVAYSLASVVIEQDYIFIGWQQRQGRLGL